MSAELVDPLGDNEREQLAHSEQVIEEGYVGFLKVGLELAHIRDGRLYRESHRTFAEYCDARWHLSKTRAYELMGAHIITEALSAMADTPAPENERQARELAGLPVEVAAKVMREAAKDGPPTAMKVRVTREEIAPKPAHVTNTTRTTETTKTEHDIDRATGEILTSADLPPAEDPIGDAKREAANHASLKAHNTIGYFRHAYQSLEAIGGPDEVMTDLYEISVAPELLADSWRIDLELCIESAQSWLALIRRTNLRSVK